MSGAGVGPAMVGLDYRSAPLAIRERLRLSTDAEVLEFLAALPWPSVVLSTCHRVEVYVHADGPAEQALAEVERVLAERGGLSRAAVAAHSVRRTGEEAVRHLVEVACGLHSAVVGEPQILGQVRSALELARRAGRSDAALNRLFERAVHAGKEVRTRTRVGHGSPSLARAAVRRLARDGLELGAAHLVIVGSGEMAMLALREVAAAGAARVTLCARRPEAALDAGQATLEAAAGGRGAGGTRTSGGARWRPAILEARPIGELAELLATCDAVISATTAPGPVIRAETLRWALSRRPGGRPLRVVDLAVPRDVEAPEPVPSGLVLFSVDELVPPGQRAEVPAEVDLEQARTIAAAEAAAYLEWWRQRQVVDSLRSMRRQAEAVRDAELQWALRRLGSRLDDEGRAVLQRMTERLTNKLLHLPTLYLKALGAAGAGDGEPDGVAGRPVDLRPRLRGDEAAESLPAGASPAGVSGTPGSTPAGSASASPASDSAVVAPEFPVVAPESTPPRALGRAAV